VLTIFCYECTARVDDGDGKHVINVAKTCLAMATQVIREVVIVGKKNAN